jgi:hypothetical protein
VGPRAGVFSLTVTPEPLRGGVSPLGGFLGLDIAFPLLSTAIEE